MIPKKVEMMGIDVFYHTAVIRHNAQAERSLPSDPSQADG
jgi:hypothetical protein